MSRYDKVPLLKESDTTDSDGSQSYGTNDVQVVPKNANRRPINEDPRQQSTSTKKSKFIYVLAFFSAIGGFLFGYDTGVVSGALILIKEEFQLTVLWQELFVSITIAFAAIFSFLGGSCNDRFGRRPIILLASFVFMTGAIILGASMNKWMLLIGRAVIGAGIGFSSMTVPVYISECAPVAQRGRLIVLNSLFITGGQFVASVVDGLFSNVNQGWRYMLGLAGFPALLQLIGFMFLPESPRWLIGKRRVEKGTRVLQRIRASEDVSEEIESIQATLDSAEDTSGVFMRAMKTKTVRKAIFVGCMLQMFQQISGINTVMYYSASIIKMSGVKDNSTAIWLAAGTASINFLFTIVGLYLVERIGRRPLTLGSLIGTTLSLALLAVAFQLAAVNSPPVTYSPQNHTNNHCQSYSICEGCIEDRDCGFCFTKSSHGVNGSCIYAARSHHLPDPTHSDYSECSSEPPVDGWTWAYEYCPTSYAWMALFGLVLYLACFAPGMGPMPWTINSEIYPLWARSTGTSLSTATNWTFNLLISMTFLTLTETITRYGAFYLYTGLAFLGCIFVFIFVPETKGTSLENVHELFL